MPAIWEKAGANLSELPHTTVAEAIASAGLDWPVKKTRAFYQKRDEAYAWNGGYNVIREDLDIVLGRVGGTYTVFQNKQVFDFVDPLLLSKAATLYGAGALKDGAQMWMLAQLVDHATIGSDDHLVSYLIVSAGHDGKTKLEIRQATVRTVSNATLPTTLTSSEQGEIIRIKHTPGIVGRAINIQKALDIMHAKFQRLVEVAHKLSARPVSQALLDQFLFALESHKLDGFVPDEFRKSKRYAELMDAIEHTPGCNLQAAHNTWWGAVSAIAYYIDHLMKPHGAKKLSQLQQDEARLASAWFGVGAKKKNRALEYALKLSEDQLVG